MIIEEIEARVHRAIDDNDLALALDIVKKFVFEIFCDDAATGVIFGSKNLDYLCLKIGESAEKINLIKNEGHKAQQSGIVLLASHIELYGGHSRVCIDLINNVRKLIDIHLVITDIHGVFDEKGLGINCPILVAPKNIDSAEKLIWIVETISNINPAKIILFNHHHDSVCIAAMTPFLGKVEIIFNHHGDHNLTLGVHLPSVIHVDQNNIGYFSCKDDERLSGNLYLPLAIPDRGKRLGDFLDGELKTCSCGSFGPKFGIRYKYKYFDFVVSRLMLRAGKHVHVGNIPEVELNSIYQQLEDNKISLDRFIHVNYVDSLWDYLREESIDLYISSFPMAGARATLEAMGAGVPILIHDSSFQRFFSGKDSAYPGVFLWKTKSQFEDFISSVNAEDLKLASISARNHYLKYHSRDYFLEFVLGERNDSSVEPPPLVEYLPDRLEAYLYKKEVMDTELVRLTSQFQELQTAKEALQVLLEDSKKSSFVKQVNIGIDNKYFNKLNYFVKRIHAVFNIYQSPFKKVNFSNYLLIHSLSLIFSFRINKLVDFLSQEKILLSYILILQEKLDKKIIRETSNNLLLINSNLETIIFDHFGGGGSSYYSQQVQREVREGSQVAKVGFLGGWWFFLLNQVNSNEIRFCTFESHKLLFDFLNKLNLNKFIFNSVYGVDELGSFTEQWKSFKHHHKHQINSVYVMHDYLPLCPSLHLSNYLGNYCHTPESKKCNYCYDKLDKKRWAHNWTNVNLIPKTIEGWREQFIDLFSHIDKIEIFNESTIEILNNTNSPYVNKLCPVNIKLDRHQKLREVVRGKVLNIGVIGDLSSIKGIAKVKELASYLKETLNHTPITVLGNSEGLPNNVRCHGKYEIDHLPDLVEEIGINVIFFPSIVPETFSYVLTEIFAMKIPVVCFNLGAQMKRVEQYPLGLVISMESSPDEIYKALSRAAAL